MKKKTVREELEDIAPFLADIKEQSKGRSGQVPEGYFEEFRSEFFNKVEESKEDSRPKEAKVVKLSWRYIAVAASVAVLVLSLWFNNTLFVSAVEVQDSLTGLSIEEMYDYLDANIEEFAAEELASIAIDNEMDDFGIIELGDEIIEEEYLDDEYLDAFDYEDLL